MEDISHPFPGRIYHLQLSPGIALVISKSRSLLIRFKSGLVRVNPQVPVTSLDIGAVLLPNIAIHEWWPGP